MKKIFLDLDGLIVNFNLGASILFDVDYDDMMSRWPPGSYDMSQVLGITKSHFYRVIDDCGEKFWANLPAYSYAREFYEHCVSIAPTYILTAPTLHPSCASGKIHWINKWLGQGFRDFILTPRKEMCAKDTHVLIDDHVDNVEKFREHGGRAILWPAWHNSRYGEAANCVDIVKKELERIWE